MKTVGIRNLKNSLSKYIKLAKSGEKILITDHEKIVAEIISTKKQSIKSDLLEKYLSEQAEEGKLLISSGKRQIKKKEKKKEYNWDKIKKFYEETRNDRL